MTEADAQSPASVVFIYGPPGVGKLTAAREVVALTGYRLFDNHMSIDWAHQIFPKGSPGGSADDAYARLRDRFRIAVFEEAMRAHAGIVATFVYAHPVDLPYVERLFEAIESEGGRLCLVQLQCEAGEHARRVEAVGREAAGKISTAALLHEVMADLDVLTPIPDRASLHIEVTDLTAAEVASRIVEHFELN